MFRVYVIKVSLDYSSLFTKRLQKAIIVKKSTPIIVFCAFVPTINEDDTVKLFYPPQFIALYILSFIN